MNKVYLSGATKFAPKIQGWRVEAEQLLSHIDMTAFNPNKYFDYKKLAPETEKECRKFLLKQLETSNVVLVNLNQSALSVGTGWELAIAEIYNIPIIGFGNEDTYSWCVDACWKICTNLQEAIEYINYYYN